MISKKLTPPLRLFVDQALLNHLPISHPARPRIEDALGSYRSGFIGQQNLAYFLDLSDLGKKARIFYDLHPEGFQMDTLILAPTFISIIECKNYSGTLIFISENGQIIRCIGGRRDGFANPLLQVGRHRKLLKRWLAACGNPPLPIETDVVIASPSTIIENQARSRRVQNHVFHAEQAPHKLRAMMEKHSRDRDYSLILQKIEEKLLQDHIAPFTDVLKKISIYPSELLRGVQCPSCHRFTMQRIYAGWHCPSCNGKFKSAHEPMIKCAPQSKTGDALTILDTFFTNRCLLNHGSRQSSRFSQFFLF
ncbi:NERD domain-containing protein [Sporolactobacillus terrae]|uniref:NERD domain-containing protein n=1 Tax=Sporolactobacillus terrae TaxID=269673 RepID=UPI000686F5AE|nr:NERD domain-containing protein [Sporolactobacillus terrae]